MNIFQSSQIQKISQKRGFALMIAALISSIVLALGAAIYDISIKQLSLSSLSRETQFAFYAADTAAECALYWDNRYSYYATTTPSGVTPTCDGTTLAATAYQGSPPSGTTATQPYSYPYYVTFQFAPNGYCANVTVIKTKNITTGVVTSVIHADGYNTACASIATSRIALQRSVELTY